MIEPEVLRRIQELEKLCVTRGRTIALAESCTGGLLASWICAYPGASRFFQGAVVSYSRVAKENVLGVPAPLLRAHGEVSLPVARAMAVGARRACAADWAVAVTGIAGPGGGSPAKPVGYVCFGGAGPGFEEASLHVFPAAGGRQDIQRQAALFAFDFLLNAIR